MVKIKISFFTKREYFLVIFHITVFDLITAHTPISAVNQFLSLQITVVYFYFLLYKNICCLYSFELPRLVEAIQISNNNICFHKENQKQNRTNIIKYALIQFPAYLSCKFVMIR